MIINSSFQYNTYNPAFAARFPKPNINLSKKELRAQINKGVTIQAIAEQNGVSSGYIYSLIRSFNIQTQKQKRLKQIKQQMKLLDAKMPDLLSKNATLKQIEQETGCSQYVVEKWCSARLDKTYLESKIQNRISRLKELNEQGANNKEISKQLGITGVTVRKIRQQYGLINEFISQQEISDLIIEKSRQGMRIKDIAKQLNISKETVSRYRVRAGVKKEIQNDRQKFIEDMMRQGVSLRKIAKKLNITEGYIYKYSKGHGFDYIAKQYKQELAQKIVDMHKQGVPLIQIARELNVSPRTVSYKVQEFKNHKIK